VFLSLQARHAGVTPTTREPLDNARLTLTSPPIPGLHDLRTSPRDSISVPPHLHISSEHRKGRATTSECSLHWDRCRATDCDRHNEHLNKAMIRGSLLVSIEISITVEMANRDNIWSNPRARAKIASSADRRRAKLERSAGVEVVGQRWSGDVRVPALSLHLDLGLDLAKGRQPVQCCADWQPSKMSRKVTAEVSVMSWRLISFQLFLSSCHTRARLTRAIHRVGTHSLTKW